MSFGQVGFQSLYGCFANSQLSCHGRQLSLKVALFSLGFAQLVDGVVALSFHLSQLCPGLDEFLIQSRLFLPSEVSRIPSLLTYMDCLILVRADLHTAGGESLCHSREIS